MAPFHPPPPRPRSHRNPRGPLLPLTLAAIIAATTPIRAGADSTWIAPTGSGSWGDSSNWSNGVPNGATQIVQIDSPVPGTITLDGSRTLGTLDGGPAAELISPGSGGSLIFNNGTANAYIYMGNTTVTIDASIVLASNLTVYAQESPSVILGDISGAQDITFSSSISTLAGDCSYNNTFITGGALTVGVGGTTGSLGTGSITNSGTLIFNVAAPRVINSVISGSGAFTQAGAAPLTMTAANTYTGTTSVGQNSSLILDYAATPVDVLNPSSALLLGTGGTLTFLSAASGTSLQTFSSTLSLEQGSTLNVIDRPGGSMNIQFGATYFTGQTTVNFNGALGGTVTFGPQTFKGDTTIIADPNWTVNLGSTLTRGIGYGSIDFQGSANLLTTASNTSGTILGPWATINSRDWAIATGTHLVPLLTYVNNTWNGGDTTVTSSNSVFSGTANSLRFDAPGPQTLTLSGINTINSGGVLITLDVGSALTTITGGILQPGPSHEIILNQLNTAGTLVLASVISDNASPTSLTKLGPGTNGIKLGHHPS